MRTREHDPESAEHAIDREDEGWLVAHEVGGFEPPLTYGLDPESPEYAGAAEEERWTLQCDLEDQLRSYLEETQVALLEQHGALPDEGHGFEDIEQRMAVYRGDPSAAASDRWRADDFEIALDILAPAQRQDLLARGHQSDLSRTSPDHALEARTSRPQDVGPQPPRLSVLRVTLDPQRLGEAEVSARLQSALERAHEQVGIASRSCALAGGPRSPDKGAARHARRIEGPGSLDGLLLGSHEDACRELNSALRQVHNLIRTNPLWQDANLRIESPPWPDLVAPNERLQAATARLTDAESAFNLAYDQLESWTGRPAWRRTAQDVLLRSGQTIEQNYDRARQQLSDERLAYARTVNEVHREWGREKQKLGQQRELARHWRNELEAPLRALRLEQSIVRDVLTNGRDVRPLEAATAHETLVFSERRMEPFGEVYEFRSNHALYRADPTTLQQSLGNLPLVPGAKLQLVDESGQRRLTEVEASPPIERQRSHGLGR